MFGVLKGLAEVVVKTAVLPVTIAADVVTLGGELADKKQSYTGEMLGSISKSIEDMSE